MHVVVVGAGIVGLASAHALAERGVEVTVCERSTVGSGSTERAAGGIRAQFSTPVNVELSLASMRVWEAFEERFGEDIDYRRNGYLFLARSPETADAFETQVAMQRDRGVPVELLTPAEAHDHCPGLRTEAFVAATYSPTDGVADPHLALGAYARAAREAGADIRTETPVTDILCDGTAVTGVVAAGERIRCDVVVNAAGPWAGRVAELAGLDLPIVPRRRQAAIVDPERSVPTDDPLVIDLETGSYFRPERAGSALVGGQFGDDPPADPDGYSRSMDLEWAARAVERAGDAADYFGDGTRIRSGWAGLYAVTPDHHPIIGESRPGLVTAAGFSGHGFQHAPATAQVVAELACDGHPSTVDVSALSGDRFERGDLVEERNVA